uniref:Uncharacterized protein n=1 Tax=Salix viminalis TaxID=40686 RepID=A0A6N2LFN6_SALVM
MCCVQGYRISL